MRIIAGKLKRRQLKTPKGYLTRPTTDRARESVFALIESRLDLQSTRILDLFAGTGALAYEALSRGAGHATLVEKSSAILKIARENAALLGVADSCVFLRSDVLTFLNRYSGTPFDVVVADPPYELAEMRDLPDLALPLVRGSGVFVLEHDSRHHFDDHPYLETARPYGRTIASVFRLRP